MSKLYLIQYSRKSTVGSVTKIFFGLPLRRLY
nr:MAG TPA: hypothetical protein [Caudoviricetes sp.]